MKIKFSPKADEEKKRLDAVLAARYPQYSRANWNNFLKDGLVSIDKRVAKANTRIALGNIIKADLTKIDATKSDETVVSEVVLDIPIVFENDDLLVLNKPAGVLSHPASENDQRQSVAGFIKEKYPEISKIGENPLRPGIMHRLDKEVSGLMVIDKTQPMFEFLKQSFKDRLVKKFYTALVYDPEMLDSGDIRFRLMRSQKKGRIVAMPETSEAGRDAHTSFEVLERFNTTALLRVQIHTGRTHQIRVHFFAYRHPLVGDTLYKTRKRHIRPIKLDRIFLHASELTIPLPDGTEKEWICPLPTELKTTLKKLKP